MTATASTVGDALATARASSSPDGPLTPATAHALLAYVTGKGRAWLLAHREAPLTADQAARYAALIERATAGEPLAHLIGEREFYGLPFAVTPDVLVPRPETEGLVDAVLHWADAWGMASPRLVDVGTGSGAIAVTLALKLPRACVTAVDVSWPALEIAQANARRHSVDARVGLALGDLLAPVGPGQDAIAANLPYVNAAELAALEVGRWEPRVALDGGADGLALVRRLLGQAPARLAPGGLLALEIGHDQGETVKALCWQTFPLAKIALHKDLAGLSRIVTVELPA
jgi:release factor glutamine methyltransferase